MLPELLLERVALVRQAAAHGPAPDFGPELLRERAVHAPGIVPSLSVGASACGVILLQTSSANPIVIKNCQELRALKLAQLEPGKRKYEKYDRKYVQLIYPF